MRRIAALDGARGLAILCVIGLHQFGFRQGWIGVDVFFALSGYLITTTLLNERSNPGFWGIFYTRRVTRIVPAFLLLLLLAGFCGLFEAPVLWPYLAFFGANLASVRHAHLMNETGLPVLWSLAVEEHFYLVWPVQVKRFSSGTLVKILTCVVLLEPFVRAIATTSGADWRYTYYLTPFRLDGLALGSLLALCLARPDFRAKIDRSVTFALPLTFLAVIAAMPFLVQGVYVFFCSAIGYSLIAIFATTLLAHLVLRPMSLLSRAMSWAPLVFLGRISYGLYLYHYPAMLVVRRFATAHGHPHGTWIVSIPFSILFAWLSFRSYENVFLRWGRRRVGRYREENPVPAQEPVHAI